MCSSMDEVCYYKLIRLRVYIKIVKKNKSSSHLLSNFISKIISKRKFWLHYNNIVFANPKVNLKKFRNVTCFFIILYLFKIRVIFYELKNRTAWREHKKAWIGEINKSRMKSRNKVPHCWIWLKESSCVWERLTSVLSP